MAPDTRIQLCEPFVVRLRGERVDAGLANPQIKRLFVYLALNRMRTATRSELIDAVWNEAPPPAADTALSALLSKIRRAELTDAYIAARIAQDVAKRPLLPDEEGAWLDQQRAELAEMLLQAHECYTEACLGIGGSELDDGVQCARLLVAMAPFRENGTRLLMEALAAEGNVAEALRAFEALRALLREELGADPGHAVRAVHQRLLTQQV